MRKIINALIVVCLLILTVIPKYKIEAKTLNDLYSELDNLKTKKQETINKKNQTTSQINKTRIEIITKSQEIEQAHQEMIKAQEEIERLNIEIEEKDAETKEIVSFLQVAEGESAYLEYAFGAKNMADFIYRISIVEQLANYNNNLLKEMHNMIVKNNNKKIELKKKELKLAEHRKSLSGKLGSLNNELTELRDTSLDIDSEIKAISDLIKSYEALGCKRNEDINVCASVPLDTKFVKPVTSGRVTSNFGYREFYLNRKLVKGYHYGIDMISTQGEGAPIHAPANGRVVATMPRQRCGGNMLFMHHVVNGVRYTTLYAHLLTINVKVGDIVNRNTKIATIGGGSTSTTR